MKRTLTFIQKSIKTIFIKSYSAFNNGFEYRIKRPVFTPIPKQRQSDYLKIHRVTYFKTSASFKFQSTLEHNYFPYL